MPNMRLNLTSQDNKALGIFFTNKTYKHNSDYMKLTDSWKSTSEISKELNEPWKRTLQRLEKFSGFGFVDYFSVQYHERTDRYWAINREAVYYILSTLNGGKLVAFLRSNKDKVREFSSIEELVLKRDVQVQYLTSQITNIVNNYQYFLIKNFIEKWRVDNIPGRNLSTEFYRPDRKKVLKRVYGKDKAKMEELFPIFEKKD